MQEREEGPPLCPEDRPRAVEEAGRIIGENRLWRQRIRAMIAELKSQFHKAVDPRGIINLLPPDSHSSADTESERQNPEQQ